MNTSPQLMEPKVLVRAMDLVRGQAKAHKDDGSGDEFLESGEDGDGAAFFEGNRGFAKGFMDGLGSGLIKRGIRRRLKGRRWLMQSQDGNPNPRGRKLMDIPLKSLPDFFGILAGH